MSRPESSSKHLLQIGEVAERVGLSLRTVRYYEEMGLVVPETRTEGGFRLYTDDHIERLGVIKRMKPLGFTVQEMTEVFTARDALAADPGDEQARALLARYADDTAARCNSMRAKVERGEQLAEQLRQESTAPVARP